jgi:hypothetical protein
MCYTCRQAKAGEDLKTNSVPFPTASFFLFSLFSFSFFLFFWVFPLRVPDFQRQTWVLRCVFQLFIFILFFSSAFPIFDFIFFFFLALLSLFLELQKHRDSSRIHRITGFIVNMALKYLKLDPNSLNSQR